MVEAMDRQLIKTLIDVLQASGLAELEYTRDGETLRLSKAGARFAASATPLEAGPLPPVPVPGRPNAGPPTPAAGGAVATAPLYGVVHLQRAPGADPFVVAGQEVTAGQVLCTVEAMKVFTEVRAYCPGTVETILVTDGQEVEPGEPLVRLA